MKIDLPPYKHKKTGELITAADVSELVGKDGTRTVEEVLGRMGVKID